MAYSEGLPEEAREQAEEPEAQGYVLHGDIEALRALTPELILEAVRAKLGELGVETAIEVTPVADLSPLAEFAADPEPADVEAGEPFFIDYDFLVNSTTLGSTSYRLVRDVWASIMRTAVATRSGMDPVTKFRDYYQEAPLVAAESDKKIDVRSIRRRILESQTYADAWVGGDPLIVEELIKLVNELLPENERIAVPRFEDFDPATARRPHPQPHVKPTWP